MPDAPQDAAPTLPAPNPLAADAAALGFGGLDWPAILALRTGTAWRRWTAGAGATGLLDIAAIDAFLRTAAARHPAVSLVDSHREGHPAVPPDRYVQAAGIIDLPRLQALFDGGATLVLTQFDEQHPPLARFCRGLEHLFRHPVQANVYLTPPGGQGFRLHYDTHDVLVLQILGRKVWEMWDRQPVAWPTGATPWQHGIPVEGEPHSFELVAGDALYIPRGTLHRAAATEAAPSMHLTIGLLSTTRATALRLLVDALEAQDASLRETLPSWALHGPDLAPLAEALADAVARLSAPEAMDRLMLALIDRLATDRQPLPERGLLEPPLAEGEPLRLADLPLHALVADGAEFVLRWAGPPIPVSATEVAWLDALAAGTTLAALGPEARDFCTTLHRAGLLHRG